MPVRVETRSTQLTVVETGDEGAGFIMLFVMPCDNFHNTKFGGFLF